MFNEINEYTDLPETHEYESRSTSTTVDQNFLINPDLLRSYSSLESVTSCSDLDDNDCRMIKLNNTIKKLIDLIDDRPCQREDTAYVCCLLRKFLKYNGTDGFVSLIAYRIPINEKKITTIDP